MERAIRKGVRGVNLESMDVNLANVNFTGKQADATVSFTPKGGLLSQGVTMRYTLEQKDGDWVIVSRSQAGTSKHAGDMQAPPAAIPPRGVDNQAGSPAPEGSQALPPNHPPLDGPKK